MMKRIWMTALFAAALLTSACPAMAYKVIVNIDGPAIAPNCTEMYVEFVLEDNTHNGSKFWPQFDGNGRMTSVIANYWGVNYPYTASPPVASFTVKDLPKKLKEIKVNTCHGKTFDKSFGSSDDDQTIFIRKDKIEKL
jgi:hypothetical protein